MNKDILIKQISESMELPEELIRTVISFQGEDALKAVKVHDEVEFSGFGKFYLSQIKLKNRIRIWEIAFNKLKQDPLSDPVKLNRFEDKIKDLKTRVK